MINKVSERNRFNLWNYFRSKRVITLPNTQEKYEDWKRRKFIQDDQTVIDFFDKIIKPNYSSIKDWSVDKFFKNYVCDINPGSDYCKAGAKPSTDTTNRTDQPQQSSVFGCLFSADNRIKKTIDPKQVRLDISDQKWFFWDDGDFRVKEGDINKPSTNRGYKGKWKCDGVDKFIINTEDGYTYSSKTKEWVKVSNNNGKSTNTIKLSDIKNGTKSVKIGAKGSFVTKIQDLLIGLGYNDVSNSGKSDGNFGPKTDGMVKKYQKDNGLKDDGVVGAKTIAALLGGKSDATKVEPAVTATQPDNIQGTDGVIIKEKEKLDILQESVKKLLRKSLLGFRKK